MAISFGEKIRESRKQKGLTQKQLADLIGAAHNSISDWENNKNKPDPDTIELLCGALKITPNYLLASTEEDFSPKEKGIIKKYRDLDPHGKEMVDFTLLKEWERSTAEAEKSNVVPMVLKEDTPDHLKPQAAHPHADTEEELSLMREDISNLKRPE